MKEIDQIIAKLKEASYDGGKHIGATTVISNYSNKNEVLAIRQVLLEWIQENFSDKTLECEILQQRVSFLEAMVAKSTFAPFAQIDQEEG